MASDAVEAATSDELAYAAELERLDDAETRGDVDRPVMHRARPSEVFSVRLPEQAAARLRRLADREGVSAGVMLRRWALSALTGDSGERLTFRQVEELFRDTLQHAAAEAMSQVAKQDAGPALNLGPRLVHRPLRERRAP